MLADICTPTGVKHDDVAVRILDQVRTRLVRPKPNNMEDALRHAITTIAELGPQNAMEAFLATQMVATHEAALLFLNRATQDGQTMDSNDAYVLRATRLMRLHLDQLEAMQKLKGKTGQQRVTVEHVHVHKGGQAIVGAVSAANQTGGRGKWANWNKHPMTSAEGD
jgi:hypothetical protein